MPHKSQIAFRPNLFQYNSIFLSHFIPDPYIGGLVEPISARQHTVYSTNIRHAPRSVPLLTGKVENSLVSETSLTEFDHHSHYYISFIFAFGQYGGSMMNFKARRYLIESLSVWVLHVLPASARVFSGCFSFLPKHALRLMGDWITLSCERKSGEQCVCPAMVC